MKRTLLSVFIILAVLVTDANPMGFLVRNAEAQADAATEDTSLISDIMTESLTPYTPQESLAPVYTEPIASSTPTVEPPQEKLPREYVEDEVIVKYKESKIDLDSKQGRAKAESVADVLSLDQVEGLPQSNISVLRILDGESVEDTIEQLERNTNVEYAQPNYQYESATNDTHFSKLWALENTGQVVDGLAGTSDADTDTPEAWVINQGTNATNSIIVAVIDIGVAYNHPDLVANMWDGTNCVSDEDIPLGNCVHGYDYDHDDNDNDPLPINSSHGTHIAGTIASINSNSTGVTGIAPNAKIMAIRTSLSTLDNIKSINFAKYNGAKVINASWAGASYDQALKDAIDAFPGIFVAAAGNNNRDNEGSHLYPSDFDSANIISVAATDQDDSLASFSNFGATSVDVGAPGTNIYSTILDEQYGFLDGTSMAAPHVAGLSALLMGYNPALTTAEVKNIILTTGDSKGSLSGKTVSGKRINAQSALLAATPRKAITLFNFTSPAATGVINEGAKTVILTIPYGTTLSALVPTIQVSPGASVSPTSLTAHDFSASSTYTVTALDGTTQAYEVAVVVAPASTAKDISTFSFPQGAGTIAGTNISVTVPYGTSVTSLTPTISITGASISPLSGVPQDFTTPVTYTVTAEDSTTKSYLVTVQVQAGGGSSGGGGGGGGGSSSKSKKTVPKAAPITTLTSKTPIVATSSVPVPVIQTVPQSYLFLVDLSIGSTGKDVSELQKRLTQEGVYTGEMSGYFGRLTQNGVKAYQSKMSLESSGYLGAQSRAKLNAPQPKATTVTAPNATKEALLISLKAQLAILLKELALLLQ